MKTNESQRAANLAALIERNKTNPALLALRRACSKGEPIVEVPAAHVIAERQATEQAIGRDLAACDLGLALTKDKTRRVYAKQRKACFAGIRELNRAEGLDGMSDAELLAKLTD